MTEAGPNYFILPGVLVRTHQELLIAKYLGRREASIMVLLLGEPSDNAVGVAQLVRVVRAT